MIYKFINGISDTLEVTQHGKTIQLIVADEDLNFKEIVLDETELYDLIGALHSIQTKMKKEVCNG